MANVCELTRRGYRDVSLNKIIIKTKAPPIRPFPRGALVSIQIDPRSALRGFIAGVLQFGDASELHFREFVDTSLVLDWKVGQVSIPADSAAAMESRPMEFPDLTVR
jgi:hypothetical protein